MENRYRPAFPRRSWRSIGGYTRAPRAGRSFRRTSGISRPPPRIQGWGEGLKSRINARPPETRTDYRDHVQKASVPLVSHEIGQWCVDPNFDEIKKYTGHLKPRNFEIFRDLLEANHMGDQARAFLLASGKLQTLPSG